MRGWHIKKDGEDKDENAFKYVDGFWMQEYPDYYNPQDDYDAMSEEFDPDYFDYNPEYEG